MLSIEQIDTYYGAIAALQNVSLHVEAGEIVGLIGANGAGKTTLLMSICGNPHPSRGQIIFDGQDITNYPTHKIAHLGIAHAPEGRRVFPRMSVLENLQMGTISRTERETKSDLERIFTLFPRLQERQNQRGGTLSGGEQQMLAIGRALMSRPRLLLLDEPSLGLAPLIVKQIFAAISEINKNDGMTILLVEQNAYHALQLAHRGYVLVNGRVAMEGKGKDLLHDPKIRAAYLEGGA